MSDLETSKGKSSWGGKREGAGRPKGSMNEASKDRMATKAAFVDRVNKNADKLFNAQLDLAVGEKYLMRKVTERDSKGKVLRVYHEMVTDPQTIIDYLDSELEDGGPLHDDESYYYMTTKVADNRAIDSLLNRSFGKAEEKLDVTTDGESLNQPAKKSIVDAFIEGLKDDTADQAKPN